MRFRLLTMIFVAAIFLSACEKKDSVTPEVETSIPVIVSLNSDKPTINFGGEDFATISCEATGGGLSYEWEVDLGDIFVLNEDGSRVRFTGSECCIGDKIVKCTATNDKGSVSETVTINIIIP